MHTRGTAGRLFRLTRPTAITLAAIIAASCTFLATWSAAEAQTPKGPMTPSLVKKTANRMAQITPAFSNKRRVVYKIKIVDNANSAWFWMKVKVKPKAKKGWCRYHYNVQYGNETGEHIFGFHLMPPTMTKARADRGVKCPAGPNGVSMTYALRQ